VKTTLPNIGVPNWLLRQRLETFCDSIPSLNVHGLTISSAKPNYDPSPRSYMRPRLRRLFAGNATAHGGEIETGILCGF
jgi:hypothetical protein